MTTETPAQPIPVYVAGNATIHAGRRIGAYESGAPRYAKLCSASRRDRHDPSPVGDSSTAITCKRCVAKLSAQAPTSPTTTNPSNNEETTMSETTKKSAAKSAAPKPAVETTPEALAAQVEKVAKATRLRGVAVEVRQNGTRPVVTIEDDAGKRILAYVSPLKRGGFRIHVQDYGVERVLTVEDVAAAAALVKTSERRQPKVKKPKAAKPAGDKLTLTISEAGAEQIEKATGGNVTAAELKAAAKAAK